MAKLTNHTKGPKGVNLADGSVHYIEAGQSAEVELTDGELAAAKATGWFSKPKDGDDDEGDGADKALADLTVNELKALAEAEAVDLGDATKKADIIAAIELAREAKASA